MAGVSLGETVAARLERVAPRARLLLGAPSGGMSAQESELARIGPPDEQDRAEIAACIRATVAESPNAGIGGCNPDTAADGIAAGLVARARSALQELQEGADTVSSMTADDALAFEAVLRVRGRPSLRLTQQRIEPIDDHKHPGSGFWRPFYQQYEEHIVEVAAATGAIIVKDNWGNAPWVQGTAWLVRPDLVLTNRHVLFPVVGGVTLARRAGDDPLTAQWKATVDVTLDFALDEGPAREATYATAEILFVSSPEDPVDVAILRVKPLGVAEARKATPLEIGREKPGSRYLYVLGHPGKIDEVPAEVMTVFGTPDGRKRVSFGKTLQAEGSPAGELLYDASTVGGFSGGCVLNFCSDVVVGLHYFGDPVAGNRAIKGAALRSHPVARFFEV